MSGQVVLLIVVAWSVMTAGLAIFPSLLDGLVSDPWPIVISWAVVSLVWVPVEAILRDRLSALARFAINVPLWIAAGLCAYWLRSLLGLP